MRRFYITILTIFLLGLIGILVLTRFYNTRKQKIVETIVQEKKEEQKQSGDMRELLESNTPIKCDFSQNVTGFEVYGTFYVHNQIVRADITAPNKNNEVKISHAILKKDKTYVWYDNELLGVVIDSNTQEQTTETSASFKQNPLLSPVTSTLGLGVFNNPDYKCEVWHEDPLKFVVPPDVKFVSSKTFYQEFHKQLCTVCDDEPDQPSRLLCRKTLECN